MLTLMESECLIDDIRLRAHTKLECPNRLRLDVEYAHLDNATRERGRAAGRRSTRGRRAARTARGGGMRRDLPVLPALVLEWNVDELLCLQPQLAALEHQTLLERRVEGVEALERAPLVGRVDNGHVAKLGDPIDGERSAKVSEGRSGDK